MYGLKHIRSWLRGTRKETATFLSAPPPTSDIRASARSIVGKVRANNEDSVVFHKPANPQEFQARGAIALVADGMGGARGGEIASQIIARLVPKGYFASRKDPPIALKNALESAGREIYRRGQREEGLEGMGATCIVLALKASGAWAAWVGDSRLYLVRDGQIFQMTEDHSMVNEMVRRGLLTREEAFSHKDRNVVTRALGSHAHVEIEVWEQPFPVRVGDRFLLCSDGLHDLMTNDEILKIAAADEVHVASGHLIEEANMRGGYDNISAVLLELVVPGSTRSAPSTREFLPCNGLTT
jgi:PPM family protein phosphatase